MKKSLLLFLLTGVMLMGLTAPAMAAAENTGFSDVAPDAWYAEAVVYCRDHGIMSGTSETAFVPNTSMTRAMLAAVLYRMAGEPAVSAANPFTDAADDAWYLDAILWARQEGIITGYGDGRFGIYDPVSRQQLAAILWRCAGSPKAESGTDFADETAIAPYAAEAVDWARANGIMNGKADNRFDPAGHTTRGEAAVILMNYVKMRQSLPEGTEADDPSILIAYFSWSDHTAQIAEEIHNQVGGDLFEIQPETPYTDDINALSGIAFREQRENARPALGTHVENMEQYDVVFVRYPCWWSNMPMPVFTFLEEYSFDGKMVVPFTAYGESVFGNSLDSIREIVGNAAISEGLAVQEHQMQDLSDRVAAWLQRIGLRESSGS